MKLDAKTLNYISGGLAVLSATSVVFGIKNKNKLNIGIGILGMTVGVGFLFKSEIQSGVGAFCQQTQQGNEAPHLGELSTGGVITFQKWMNQKYNSGIAEGGTPDQKTKDAYVQYGREFLTDVISAYQI